MVLPSEACPQARCLPALEPQRIRLSMSVPRLIALAAAFGLPVVLFAGVGGWTLWETGRLSWLWWSLPVSWGIGWLLLRRWGRPGELWPLPPVTIDPTWTPRDRAAAEIVRQVQQQCSRYTVRELSQADTYQQVAVDLATQLARHYHPGASDPVASLSVVELLAIGELVLEDLSDWARRYVPASHLVTVGQWKMLSQAPVWWKRVSDIHWVASMLYNPLNVGRFVVSKLTLEPLSRDLQGGLLTTAFALYVQQVGHYLIEVNSGRLRGGAKTYREWQRRLAALDASPSAFPVPANRETLRWPTSTDSNTDQTSVAAQSMTGNRAADDAATTAIMPASADSSSAVTRVAGSAEMSEPPPFEPVLLVVIGQVKAGKSSVVNSLLGSTTAAVDILPMTRQVARYRVTTGPGQPEILVLDTPGYADAGLTADSRAELQSAVRTADLLLLVLDASSPARQADLAVVDELRGWFVQQWRLKPPPMIAVLTHVDRLRPPLEWSPPYDPWQGSRPKEQSIRGALDYVRSTFGERVAETIPVCTAADPSRRWGLTEFLLPALTQHLREAQLCSLVKALHRDFDRERVWQVVRQTSAAGRALLQQAVSTVRNVVTESLRNADPP